jgi:hypothetical protein
MKKYLYILLSIIFITCNKTEEIKAPSIDQRIYGRWLQSTANFEGTTFIRSDRFGEYEKGIVVFEDGTIIERSEGGICIGEYCLMENFYGTYTYDSSKNALNIKVTNFSGPQKYTLEILNLSVDQLMVKRN